MLQLSCVTITLLFLADSILKSSRFRWMEVIGPDPSSHAGEAVDLNISWLLEGLHGLPGCKRREASRAIHRRTHARSRHTLPHGSWGWFFEFRQGCHRLHCTVVLSSCLLVRRQAGRQAVSRRRILFCLPEEPPAKRSPAYGAVRSAGHFFLACKADLNTAGGSGQGIWREGA